jgi:alkyl hydroperoxide reductase subunit AhpC
MNTLTRVLSAGVRRPIAQAALRFYQSKAVIQKPAPQFSCTAVVDGQFEEVKLSQYQGKYVVLFFYPLDFTFVCPTEIIAFNDAAKKFKDMNCELLAISVDSHFCHLAWANLPRNQGGLAPIKIPMLADLTKQISKDYGVLIEEEGIALRGLFVIDGKQNLRSIVVNDLPVGRSVDETLRLVQAFQFTDKHGEVCPAGWNPGADTIKPDVKGSKEYFSKH